MTFFRKPASGPAMSFRSAPVASAATGKGKPLAIAFLVGFFLAANPLIGGLIAVICAAILIRD